MLSQKLVQISHFNELLQDHNIFTTFQGKTVNKQTELKIDKDYDYVA